MWTQFFHALHVTVLDAFDALLDYTDENASPVPLKDAQ